ncbi:MAG: hydroxyacid dehydrogenase [Silicimonas sp.]|nr:hydroxyacid dehydrogenase [Silicimonas sp.]
MSGGRGRRRRAYARAIRRGRSSRPRRAEPRSGGSGRGAPRDRSDHLAFGRGCRGCSYQCWTPAGSGRGRGRAVGSFGSRISAPGGRVVTNSDRPIILSAPAPRTLDLIFTDEALKALRARYEVVETDEENLPSLPDEILENAKYVIGQPAIDDSLLERLKSLRCIFNVEGNLMNNMPYPRLFERGIHVVTTMEVFARPVAELGLALALNLMRGIVDADLDFRQGNEKWGGDGNTNARLLFGAEVGLVGYGGLGRALHRLLVPFRTWLRVYDPWLPRSLIVEAGAEPADLDTVVRNSDVVFVVAGVTSENQKFLGAETFRAMRNGASFILLSRADVVDFDALIEAVSSGHITAASDVFPQEPMPSDHPVRQLPGFIRSAHRAGALDEAFKKMGDFVLEDLALLDQGLPPARCKRAERETVERLRSRPVDVN